MFGLYLRHLVIRTPIESMTRSIKDALSIPQRLQHPELRSIFDEGKLVTEACRMILSAESNTIDVGAHLGSQLSLHLRLATRGRHVAFEPVPQKARWLRAKFPEVDVREVALNQVDGRETFFVNETRPGYSGLRKHEAGSDDVYRITVEQQSLDDAIGDDAIVDFIKIDVEGGELFVLKGATRVLERCEPTLLFESTASGLAAWGLSPDDLFQFLSEHGYQIYLPRAFVSAGRALERDEFAVAHQYPFLAFNFFAVAKGRPLGRKRVNRPQLNGSNVRTLTAA
ncbi:MAG TPA: FkbM family methyltransferase [Polyangiales bacterium]|nr:FkbM family methyltransferase [Polyangiales bacterium]